MIRGLVFGKFYPPHRGHKHLIDTATSACDELTVLVMAAPEETIPGELRTAWLAEIHPDVRVVHTPWNLLQSWPEEDETSWAAFVEFVRRYHPDPIDRIFTSEWYGESAARRLGAEHVSVDPNRTAVPISGKALRASPWTHAEYLEPCVRASFVAVVTIVGPESSGKTTLAERLSTHFQTPWVPEYGREYSDAIGHTALRPHVWSREDFAQIAREQHHRARHAAREATRVLICDTDALATQVWQERYTGVVETLSYPRADLYLLTEPDLPFVQDGTRDGEHVRGWMAARLRAVLYEERLRYCVISGNAHARFATSVAAISSLLRA